MKQWFYSQENDGFVPIICCIVGSLVDCYEGAGVKAGRIIAPINYFSLVCRVALNRIVEFGVTRAACFLGNKLQI